jgi:hypothetical protein
MQPQAAPQLPASSAHALRRARALLIPPIPTAHTNPLPTARGNSPIEHVDGLVAEEQVLAPRHVRPGGPARVGRQGLARGERAVGPSRQPALARRPHAPAALEPAAAAALEGLLVLAVLVAAAARGAGLLAAVLARLGRLVVCAGQGGRGWEGVSAGWRVPPATLPRSPSDALSIPSSTQRTAPNPPCQLG